MIESKISDLTNNNNNLTEVLAPYETVFCSNKTMITRET